MKKISLVLALVLMMSFVLCACGASNELVGEWKGEEGEIVVFEDDGTGNISFFGIEVNFTYEVADGEITMTPEDEEIGETETSEYSIDGDKLIIDGSEYTRQ
ncbi:MAG: DUF5640 domain-containing protein [Eubacteriales bacterium]|nr:DUF5640 domain-containing protein [Eubacteriales bacterium]